MATNFIDYKRKGIIFIYNKISPLYMCNMSRKSMSYEGDVKKGVAKAESSTQL